MLIGRAVEKPSLGVVRRLKRVLHTSLELPESAVITVTQLACLEDDCSPLETVFGLLQENASLRQSKSTSPPVPSMQRTCIGCARSGVF